MIALCNDPGKAGRSRARPGKGLMKRKMNVDGEKFRVRMTPVDFEGEVDYLFDFFFRPPSR